MHHKANACLLQSLIKSFGQQITRTKLRDGSKSNTGDYRTTILKFCFVRPNLDLMTCSRKNGKKEINVLFTYALNTSYIQLRALR